MNLKLFEDFRWMIIDDDSGKVIAEMKADSWTEAKENIDLLKEAIEYLNAKYKEKP